MKVVFDYEFFSQKIYGGVSRYFVELAHALSKRDDVTPTIFAPFYVNRHLAALDSPIVSGRYVAHTPPGISVVLGIANRAITRSSMARLDPDVVHKTWYTKTPMSDNRSTVVTVHDMIHERFPEYFPARDNTSELKRRAIERANHVICVSEKTRQDLLDIWPLDPALATTIHSGFTPLRVGYLPERRLVEKPFLLYVGVRGGYKNFAGLLDAYVHSAAVHKEFDLVCFGGSRPVQAELAVLESAGVDTDKLVWMCGDDSVLKRLYRDASAFVYPSMYEGFGIPPLEAMAQGCPVICSSGGSIPEVVGDAGEFFDPNDTEAISTAIERVVMSDGRRSELIAAGQRRLQDFSWAKCADETQAVYAKTI